ncbi:MAG: dethiobiotin synthase [Succinivibrio sp.]
MMKSLFVTGTGTDVGKTRACAAIARYFTRKGLSFAYYKAAASGTLDLAKSDPGRVKAAASLPQPDETLCSYLYAHPLSPHLAARTEGGPFPDLGVIEKAWRSLGRDYEYVLTEGAGGIVCPLLHEGGRRLFYIDVLKRFGIGALIVADAGLGTINHTVLTHEYLKARGVEVKGVILNRWNGSDPMHRDNEAMIREMTGLATVARIPEGSMDLEDVPVPLEDLFDEA